jgi:hypothetical protein
VSPFRHRFRLSFGFLAAMLMIAPSLARATDTIVYEPAGDGPGKGKHIVFLSGDEEYRSEEGVPMLAKILSQRHGSSAPCCFPSIPTARSIRTTTKSLPGAAALDSADAIVMLLRFRAWPDEQMKHFVDAYKRGVPIIALRTSTHAFKNNEGSYKDFNDFGKRVLGEQWVSHWGSHKKEATSGVIEARRRTTRSCAAWPTSSARPTSTRPPARRREDPAPRAGAQRDESRRRAGGLQEERRNGQGARRQRADDAGRVVRACTRTRRARRTRRSDDDGRSHGLQNEGLRRLVVNGVYWGLGWTCRRRRT